MSPTVLDDELRLWEAFASSGPHGFPAPARIVFRCVSDRRQASRALLFEGDRATAEGVVQAADADELRRYLAEAAPLS
jgi:hypothetical protein